MVKQSRERRGEGVEWSVSFQGAAFHIRED